MFLAQEEHNIDIHCDSLVHYNGSTKDSDTHDLSPEAVGYISLIEDAQVLVLRTRLEELT
jgi:hypothetical protein